MKIACFIFANLNKTTGVQTTLSVLTPSSVFERRRSKSRLGWSGNGPCQGTKQLKELKVCLASPVCIMISCLNSIVLQHFHVKKNNRVCDFFQKSSNFHVCWLKML